MPMDENSTQTLSPTSSSSAPASSIPGPKEKTLDFIRQFARIYTPVGTMPGIVLN